MAISDDLKRIQALTGCSLRDIANSIGVSYDSARSYSSGRTMPGRVPRAKISALLGELRDDNPQKWSLGEIVAAGGLLAFLTYILWGKVGGGK